MSNSNIFTDTFLLNSVSVGRKGIYVATGGVSKTLHILNQTDNSIL